MLGRAKREKGRSESCFRGLSSCGGLLRTRVVILGPLRNVLGEIYATFYVRTHGPLVHSRHPRNRGAAAPCLRATAEPPLETSSQTRRRHSKHAPPLLMLFMFALWPLLFTCGRTHVRISSCSFLWLFCDYVRTYVRTYARTHASLVIFAFRPRGGSHNARAEMATWLSASSSESSPTHERA